MSRVGVSDARTVRLAQPVLKKNDKVRIRFDFSSGLVVGSVFCLRSPFRFKERTRRSCLCVQEIWSRFWG
jgi:hypothetical protein